MVHGRWKDKESVDGYDHPSEQRKARVTTKLIRKMTNLEAQAIEKQNLRLNNNIHPAYTAEPNGDNLKVKFRKIMTNSQEIVEKACTGCKAQNILESL